MKILRGANPDSFRRQAFSIFSIKAIPTLGSVLILILFSRALPFREYGIYQNFWIQLVLLSAFVMLGIPTLALTYSSDAVSAILKQLKAGHVGIWVAWLFVFALAFGIFQSRTGIGFPVSFLFFSFYGIGFLAESLLLALKKFRFLTGLNVVYTLLFIAVHFGVLQGLFGLPQLFLFLLILVFGKTVFAVIFLLQSQRKLQLLKAATPLNPDLDALKKLWLHLGIYDMLQMLFKSSDKFLISLLLTAKISAIYFNGAQEILLLPILLGSVSSAALMQLSIPATNPVTRTIYVVNRTASVMASVVFPLFCFLFFFRTELFSVVLSEKYLPSASIFAVSLLVVPLRAYSFTTILQNQHKGAAMNVGSLMDLILAFALCYPLYRLLGLPGVALAFVVSTFAQAIFYLVIASKSISVPISAIIPWKNWMSKMLLFLPLFFGAHLLLQPALDKLFVLIAGLLLLLITSLISLRIELHK